MKDYCQYVNVFHGCEEIAPKPPKGIAAKWFFIKAGCGNTSPAAAVPFCAVSAGPYSGGYPTGYLDHCPNSHSRPPRFPEGKKLLGFAHLQQSGTGAIGYYYNYALTVPRYTESEEYRTPLDESGEPGYYAVTLDDIRCELTTDGSCAVHRYTFGHAGGTVSVDFTNNGLRIPGHERRPVLDLQVRAVDRYTVSASAQIEGVRLWFAVRANVPLAADQTAAFASAQDDPVILRVSVSLRSEDKAISRLTDAGFDEVRSAAKARWNDVLSRIDVRAGNPALLRIFYSNLYHSLIKPSDWSGESFLYEDDDAFVADLNTLWDMYKTALPLLFMLDKDITDKTTETLLRIGETLGFLPNAVGITTDWFVSETQARMLAEYALFTALHYGHRIDVKRLLSVTEADVFAENKKDFYENGVCASHTFELDMADGCAIAATVARANGETALAEKLEPLARRWKAAYDPETGLLRDGTYYEGTLYNYSFRQMVDMDARIALAGGKERFVQLLDSFFGYGAPDTVQPTDPFNYAPVEAGMKLGRFEGFNNESDTEAPYSYIYACRHDRTCEIVRGGLEYMFTEGPGGIPGNNDSGALSSYYVLSALGLFPVAGQNLFLIGSPIIDSADFVLYNGNVLHITVENQDPNNIYVADVRFDDEPLPDFRISADHLLKGGTLSFRMCNTPNQKKG